MSNGLNRVVVLGASDFVAYLNKYTSVDIFNYIVVAEKHFYILKKKQT